ncbi:MAG: hypothetical protein HY042_04040 [Spirochaetia bacterium]|nr:hypothetical protein [Spirochaetia bacterium]
MIQQNKITGPVQRPPVNAELVIASAEGAASAAEAASETLRADLAAKSEQLDNLFAQVRKLSSITQVIAGGNFFFFHPREEREENNPIGILARNFNSMIQSIKDAQQKLKEYAEHLEEMVEERTAELKVARDLAEEEMRKSDKLLRNILPDEIAEELKGKGSVVPVSYDSATIMFTDFKGFTRIAETMSPSDLVRELDGCFSAFDAITDRYNLEKLKTIGDSYMCAGGIPVPNATNAVDCCLAAIELQDRMIQMKDIKVSLGLPYWELRLGINTGPVVAGVIGDRKFAYDVWGDTVNTASRMESAGEPGRINVSESTHELTKDFFEFEARGKLHAKNKGELSMFFLNRIRPELSRDEAGRVPNDKFHMMYEDLKKRS